ncbi:helix-turn-helix transcriptional regulator [Gordonia sp. HY285]|nr:helix-turn-helix transcriptional regulator [Gordonia liuliyuniae]
MDAVSESSVLPYDVFAKKCPSRQVFEHVTGKWGALVLGTLGTGPQRFGEIRAQVEGISDRMLTQTLRTLCDDGLAVRATASPAHPVYQLTDAGQVVADAVRTLIVAVEAAMTSGAGA